MAHAIGIDLGTDQCRAHAAGCDVAIPSVVAIDTRGRVLCGDAAVAYAAQHPERTVFGVKRLLGRKLYSPEVSWLAGMSTVELVPSDGGAAWVRIGGRRLSPQEVAAYLLRHVTAALEKQLGEPLGHAVLATPAMFDLPQRHALLDAAIIAGLRVHRFVEAPAAALLELTLPRGSDRVVALDFGGGYFDVCLFERRGAGWQLRAIEGDNMLGGDDFDRRVVDALVAEFHKQHGADLTRVPRALRRLWNRAGEMRRDAATGRPLGQQRLSGLGTVDGRPADLLLPELSLADLAALWNDELQSFWAPCARLFEDLGLGTDDVDALVLLGSAAATPGVTEQLEGMFRRPARRPIDSGLLVARGAARVGDRIGDGSDLLRSVSPHSLGIKARHGRIKRFIQRHQPWPCEVQRLLATPGGALVLEVFQGESERALDDLYLGRFTFALPPGEVGRRHLVRFIVDRLGMLDVVAQDAITNRDIAAEVRWSSGFDAAARAAIAAELAPEVTLEEALARDDTPEPMDDLPRSDATPQPLTATTVPPSGGSETPPPSEPVGPRSIRGGTRRPPGVTPSPRAPRPGTLPSRGTRPDDRASDPQAEMSLDGESLVGTTLGGRYAIDRVIAQGGMGRVYHATHTVLDRAFAVKVIHPELASNESLAERFLREAKAAARIKSEHVVEILDFGATDDGTSYFVMEFVEGELLAHVLDRAPIDLALVPRIAVQVAKGLAAAHRLGIIHRDLKPENIMLVDRGGEPFAKIFDFGIAKSLTSDGRALTLVDSFVGTPHYMSPEQVHGAVDGRTDIYALGIVMYEMVTGEPPFDDESVALLLHKQRTELPRPPSQLPGGEACPPALERIILRCLEKNPDDRFDSADALRAALEPLM